jgi:hypothetical protein
MSWFRKSSPLVLQAPAPGSVNIHPVYLDLVCRYKHEWPDYGVVTFRDEPGNEFRLKLTKEDFAKLPIGTVLHLQFDGVFTA